MPYADATLILRVSTALKAELDAWAGARNRSSSDVVREAIASFIAAKAEPKPEPQVRRWRTRARPYDVDWWPGATHKKHGTIHIIRVVGDTATHTLCGRAITSTIDYSIQDSDVWCKVCNQRATEYHKRTSVTRKPGILVRGE